MLESTEIFGSVTAQKITKLNATTEINFLFFVLKELNASVKPAINRLVFKSLTFGYVFKKLSKQTKRVIAIINMVKEPNAASNAYCFTGTRSVIAKALKPIIVVIAVKKIGRNKFLTVVFAAFCGQILSLRNRKNSDNT